MKKGVIFGFGIIITLLIVNSFSVWSQSGVTSTPSPEKNKCILREGYEKYFNPVGCNCVTGGADSFEVKPLILKWARSNWDAGISIGHSDESRGDDGNRSEYYCYVNDPLSKIKPGTGNGKGKVRMCTEDNNSTYTADYTGGNERNRECSASTPFCNEDKYTCNECREDSDCSKTLFAQLNLDRLIQTKCSEQSGIKTQAIKSCEYCVRVNGTGAKKIVFVVGQLPPGKTQEEVIQQTYGGIVGTEPFKYLHEQKNAFTFAYIPVNNLNNLFEVFNERYYRGKDGEIILFYDSERALMEKAKQVCGEVSIIIYIDYFGGKEEIGYASDNSGSNQQLIVLGTQDLLSGSASHELGHAIGELADEYVLPYGRSQDPVQKEGVNIQAPNYPSVSGTCPKFTSKGVDLPNCFDVDYILNVYDIEVVIMANPGYRKSTVNSIMNNYWEEGRFNAISCAGILNKVLGTGIEQGVKYCQDTLTPEGYAIYPGIIPQGTDACAVDLGAAKSGATKSKECYCDDDPNQEKWKVCGNFCCDKRDEICTSQTELLVTKEFCKSEVCGEGKKLCPAADKPKCCGKDAACTTAKITINLPWPVKNVIKEIALCQPKECKPGTEGYCDTGDNGVSYCCTAPYTECIQINKHMNKKVCLPTKNKCSDDPNGKTQYCPGDEDKGSRCCLPGTCFIHKGIPYCKY